MSPNYKLQPLMSKETEEAIDRICDKGQPLSFDILRTSTASKCAVFEKGNHSNQSIQVEFEFDENGAPYFSEDTLKRIGE